MNSYERTKRICKIIVLVFGILSINNIILTIRNYSYAYFHKNVKSDIKLKITTLDKMPVKGEIATELVKEKVVPYATANSSSFGGGLVAVNTNGTLYNEAAGNQEIREYRYSGTGVNNYVYFNCKEKDEEGHDLEQNATNCEKWRIVGVFEDENGEEHLKIVKNETLKGEDMPLTYTVSGTEYKIRYSSSSNNAYWNNKTDYNNDWATAGLQYWLNSEHDDTETPGYLNKINATAKSMIEEKTKYYLGTVTYYDDPVDNDEDGDSYGIKDTPNEAYVNERATECADGKGPSGNSSQSAVEGNSSCRVWAGNSAIWEGSVALLYPSDYGYSADSDYWDTTMRKQYFDKGPSNTSWLSTANHGSYEWLLAPSSYYSIRVASWPTAGNVGTNNVSGNYGVRPSLNLKSQTKIVDGDGTVDNCYQLEPGQ